MNNFFEMVYYYQFFEAYCCAAVLQKCHRFAGLLKKDDKIWFGAKGYHGVEIRSPYHFETKFNYLHLNKVRAKIVGQSEDYCYSSCADYLEVRKGILDVDFV